MEELSVQARQCVLEDGITWSSFKTEVFKEKWVGLELCHESPVAESPVELKSKENKECGKGKIRRSSEGGGSVWYHIAKLDKFIKQELRVTKLGCIV